jgi:hypothetical protein
MSIEHIEINQGTIAQLFKLPEQMIDYLWERIDVAKKKKICYKNNLAGHISHSYTLEDPRNLIIEHLFKVVFNQVDNPKMFNFIREELAGNYQKVFPKQINNLVMKPRLIDLWVNFQKKSEFQPQHTHSGLFSFVIWMDIPYDWKDEAKLPFARPNDVTPLGGNFTFLYSNGNCRDVQGQIVKMSPKMNGYCVFFPGDLSHQVYPFYTSDKERISISGNIVYEMGDSSEQRSQQFPFIVSNT